MRVERTFSCSSCSQSHERGFLAYLWPSPSSPSQFSPSVLLDNSHSQKAAHCGEQPPIPMETATGHPMGQGLEKGSRLVCCSLKKSRKAGILAGKRCLELSHLGSWSLAASVKHHPQTASTWDRLHLGISYPSVPLSYEGWGGQSREWGWTQNRTRSREIGHPTRKLRYGNDASHEAAVL